MDERISEALDSLPTPPNYWFGIAICPTEESHNHCGIVYFDFKEECKKMLHLAFHHKLFLDKIPNQYSKNYLWIKFNNEIHEDEARDFAFQCNWIHNVNQGMNSIPYGINFDRALIDSASGIVDFTHGKSVGLTCSTFSMLVFKRFGIELIDTNTWEIRDEDSKWHEYIVSLLLKHKVDEDHVNIVKNENPCVRIRPEEIAASCNFAKHPVMFNDLLATSRKINQEIRE